MGSIVSWRDRVVSLLWTLVLVAVSTQAQAQTVSQQKLAKISRMIALEKLTVGPDDQYNADQEAGARRLIYTHKADLVASVHVYDRVSGQAQALLPPDADSQEAVFSSDAQVAFTYFKFNARGDICRVQVSGKGLQCLGRSRDLRSVQRANPFWIDSTTVGYLERDLVSQKSQVIRESFLNPGVSRSVLAEGKIWSPSMVPGGRYLAYIEWRSETPNAPPSRRLMIKDLRAGREFVLNFQLPGISGFPQLDASEQFLYFSHFLNDTNGDQQIDGSDNAVVFRARLKDVMEASGNAASEFFPEQLTSVGTSCSFPKPKADGLLLTCAFEGSLDIYRLPLTGVVPADWSESKLLNAIASSRTYQDRILLLNTLRFRYPRAKIDFEPRLLSDHMMAKDVRAARYFVQRAQRQRPGDGFLKALEIYLNAQELKNLQPRGSLTREFVAEIQKLGQKLATSPASRDAQLIVSGHLRLISGDRVGAIRALSSVLDLRGGGKVNGQPKQRSLLLHLQFELARDINDTQLLVRVYKKMLAAPALDEQSKVYYAFHLLGDLHAWAESGANGRRWRVARIEEILKENRLTDGRSALRGDVEDLLRSEIIALNLIETPEVNAKPKIFLPLDQILSATRARDFVRRAIYVRAMLNFSDARETRYLSAIVTNWLRYTASDDTEFAYAREVFADHSLSEAYALLGQGQLQLAENYFSQSLILTDDLESHYGYIRTKILRGLRSQLQVDYRELKKRGFVDESLKFVEAALLLADMPSASKDNVKPLEQAIALLESMRLVVDSPMRRLLLGWARMEILFRTATGYDFDHSIFQAAHRDLSLAYDLDRENSRIQASALINLGLLHQRAQNHGQAARYFELRKKLGFESEEQRALVARAYSRSLEFLQEPERAVAELKSISAPYRSIAIEERIAFNLATGDRCGEALEIYQGLLPQLTDEENRAKALLLTGFCQAKLAGQKPADAKLDPRPALERSLKISRTLKKREPLPEELIAFEPRRLTLAALGLLAQWGDEQARLQALRERLNLLKSAQGVVENAPVAIVQTLLQIAELETKRALNTEAVASLNEAILEAEAYGRRENYLGPATYRTAVNTLAHGLLNPREHRSGMNRKELESLVQNCLRVYGSAKGESERLAAQSLKLSVLWGRYRHRVWGEPAPSEHDLFRSPLATKLKSDRPEAYQEAYQLFSAPF